MEHKKIGMAVGVMALAWGTLASAAQSEGEAVCVEPNALTLDYGDHTSGCSVSPPIDVDSFQIAGVSGERVRIVILATSNSAFDPQMELFDCGFSSVALASCNTSFCSATIDTTLACTGNYTLLVSDAGSNDAGNYTLQLERIAPPLDEQLLDYGGEVSDGISPGTDIDRYRYYAVQDTLLRLTIGATSNSAFDPRVEILDPSDGTVLDQNCANNFCVLSAELRPTITGFHSLYLSDLGSNDAGNYDMVISCIVGPCDGDGDGVPDPPPPLLPYDLPTSGVLSPGVDVEPYLVDLIAGTTVRLTALATSNSAFDPQLELYDPAGEPYANASCANNFCTVTMELTPMVSGSYALFVSDQGSNDAGNYSLNLQCLLGPCDSDGRPTLRYDLPASSTVSPSVDIQPFYFYGRGGTTVRLTMAATSNSAFDPRVEIYDPNDVSVLDAGCANNFCVYTTDLALGTDGWYAVFISDTGSNDAGNFDLNLQCVDGPCDSDGDGVLDGDPPLLPLDSVHSSSISPAVDIDQYGFRGDPGTLLHIAYSATSNSAFDPQLDLLAPDGALVDSRNCTTSFCSIVFDYAPTQSGTYTLVLTDLGSQDAGNYDLLVQCLTGNCTPAQAPLDRDNCVWVANGPLAPDAGGNVQRDSNGDGYGNVCDPDLDDNGAVNFEDLGILKTRFFSTDADADFDGSGSVNFIDLGVMKVYFFQPPGPSALPCAGTVPCP